MLGCYKPDFDTLNEQEQENFKALHCSICKDIKKHYGIFETIFLNYDLDFIYLSCNDLNNLQKKKVRCTINPLKKIIVYDYEFERYSDLTILFIYVSLLDKKIDLEVNIFYKWLEKKLQKSITKVKDKIKRPIEKEVYEALKKEKNLKYICDLYSDIIVTYLSLNDDRREFFQEMLKVMYYFDSFEDPTLSN